ncbi:hypothetical protein C0992_005465 [Termitomyces sp. T32_za158]|nr:hypothetical protein C0992_005465 [Termitomyces sp. T32_za158]
MSCQHTSNILTLPLKRPHDSDTTLESTSIKRRLVQLVTSVEADLESLVRYFRGEIWDIKRSLDGFGEQGSVNDRELLITLLGSLSTPRAQSTSSESSITQSDSLVIEPSSYNTKQTSIATLNVAVWAQGNARSILILLDLPVLINIHHLFQTRYWNRKSIPHLKIVRAALVGGHAGHGGLAVKVEV